MKNLSLGVPMIHLPDGKDPYIGHEQELMDTTPHIQIRLISDPTYLCGVREMVASVARRLGFDDMDCSKISLALDEALCNVIRHGYTKAFDQPIWIGITPLEPNAESPGGIMIVIEDEAKKVDPSKIIGRHLEDIKPGGLGVHIIREVMDSVRYEPRETIGMRLTMTKRVVREENPPRLRDHLPGFVRKADAASKRV